MILTNGIRFDTIARSTQSGASSRKRKECSGGHTHTFRLSLRKPFLPINA